MNKTQLDKRISRLETVHDQLESEIQYIDKLLRSIGFPQGIQSAKQVALEIIENQEAEKQSEQHE